MGIVRRQSAYATIYSYLGVLVGFVSTGILMPNIFSPEQNGVLKLLVSYTLLAGQFGVLGFQKVISREFVYFRNKMQQHNGFFFLLIVIFVVGTAVSSILLLAFKPLILSEADKGGGLFNRFYTYLFPLAAFHIIFTLLDIYYTVLANITKSIFFKEFVQRVLILVSIGVFMLGWVDFSGFVALYAIAYSFKGVLMVITLYRAGHIFLKPRTHMLTPARLRAMLRMMMFALLGGFASIISFQIDSVMVSKFVGLSATGVYAITFFFGTLILIPQRSVQKITLPFVAEAFKNNNRQDLNDLSARTSINLFVIGALLLIGLWGNIHNIFEILPNEYRQGKMVILFIGLANLVLLSSGLTNKIIALSPLYAYNTLFVAIHAGLIILTNLLFIPLFGLAGAAVASFLSMVVITSVRIIFNWHHYRVFPYSMAHIKVLSIALAAYGLSLLLPVTGHFIVDILVRSALMVVVYLPLVYFTRVSPDINAFADDILVVIRKYLRR